MTRTATLVRTMGRLTGPAIGFAAALALAGCGAIPESSAPSRPAARQAQLPRQSAPTLPQDETTRMCMAELSTAGARYSALPDKYYAPGCNTVSTVQLTGLSGDTGAIAVSNLGPVTCDVAETLAGWARYGVDRAARAYLGSPIARIETMGSYSCRNVAGTTRLSAHSRAAAIDVSAFVLEDGRRISVKDDWQGGSKAEQQFLRVVHQSACKRFGTVLGPDYNAAHRDHFHVEGQGAKFCR